MGARPILLITGGSRGIGAAIARLASARGWDVALNYLRDRDGAEATAAAVREAGGRALTVQGDISVEADVARLFATVANEFGTPTGIVLNSGITGPASRLEDASPEMMHGVLSTNVFGVLLCARAAIPLLSTKRGGAGGSIVLMSSAAATLGTPGEFVWYAASKGAIDSLTIGLSREVALEGIRVNAVAPGLINTDMNSPERQERFRPMVPMGRIGSPEEVAEAVLFLLSDRASYVTGTTLRVGGGR